MLREVCGENRGLREADFEREDMYPRIKFRELRG